jgi:ribonuclease D
MSHTPDAVANTASTASIEEKVPHQTGEPVPHVITTHEALIEYAQKLAHGTGPLALDAERASGYTYSQRAYLIQMRREGAGTALIDPIACPDLSAIAQATAGVEWILHAATQDLPCLREVGLSPDSLFDTELAGRILGCERVGLGPLIESELGLYLEKGHGAADWSVRPLTPAMLRYAALDVELLVELRNSLATSLKEAHKYEYAQQEFDALLTWQPREHKGEAWRRTSGVHGIKSPRSRAIVRELWITRDDIARRRDVAPGRLIPDRAIIAAASAKPTDSLLKVKDFHGRGAARYERQWKSAIERANLLPESELPGPPPKSDALPPPKSWVDKNPDAFARLEYVREALAEVSELLAIPVENLMTPELVRRACWSQLDSPQEYVGLIRAGGVRQWQCELVLPILLAAREIKPQPAEDQQTPAQ